jgi:multicomponent K+:H+ antiporter subunit E
MRTWASYLLLTAALLALWLTLNQTLALGHWLLGILIAAAAAAGYAALRPPRTPMKRAGTALTLAGLVFADIVRSNIGVGRIVIKAHSRPPVAGFLDIPLELRSPAGLSVLACIITSTPGTAWAGYDSERGLLTMHVLDLIDEQAWVEIIKGRYERRLLEIFA